MSKPLVEAGYAQIVDRDSRHNATYKYSKIYITLGSEPVTPHPRLQQAAAALKAPADTTPRVIGPANERLPRYKREQAVEDRLNELKKEHERQKRGEAKRIYLDRLAHAELSASGSLAAERHVRKEVQYNQAQDHVQLDTNIGGTDSDPVLLQDTIGDRSRLQQIALAELEEILELHLTEAELRALRQRAAGVAVDRRDTLQRAQRKAQAALAVV